MARMLFGGSSDDYAVGSDGKPVTNRRVRFYTSAAMTTEITDLASDAAGTGAPLAVFTNTAGFWGPVYGPDGVTVMYAGTVDAQSNPPTYVVTVYAHYVSEVASFNGRTGAVTLTKGDVTGTGLAASDVGADASGAAATVQTNLTAEVTRAQAAEAALSSGMIFKAAAAVATTNQTLSGLPTVDGVTLTAGQVILLTGQTSGSQNGLWSVASGAWSRPSNFAAGLDATATSVLVESGTTGAGTTYAVTGTTNNVVGTNVLTFVKTSGSGAYAPMLYGLAPRGVVPTPPPDLGFVTTFQSGHGFVSSGASGSPTLNLNDTANYLLGSQSVQIVGGAGSGFQGIRHYALPAVDMSARHIALLVKVDDPTLLSSIALYAGDGSLANFDFMFAATGGPANGGATILPGKWQWIYLSPGERLTDGGSTTGTPTRTAVTDWQVRVNFVGAVTVQIGAIGYFAKPSAFPNGVITLGADDSFASQYTLMRPVLDKYGYPVSLATIVDQIGASGHMTLAQLTELRDTHGCEVIAHAYTQANHNAGFDAISPAAATSELANTKAWLLDNGFYRGADYLAWPLGRHTDSIDGLARAYYRLARSVQQYPMAVPRVDQPMNVRAWSPLNTDTVASITAKIDAAYTAGAWLNLVFHDLTTASTGLASTQYKQVDFQSIVDYIATKGMPVRTFSQIVQTLG